MDNVFYLCLIFPHFPYILCLPLACFWSPLLSLLHFLCCSTVRSLPKMDFTRNSLLSLIKMINSEMCILPLNVINGLQIWDL